MQLKLSIVIVVLALLSGCTYSPGGEHFVELNQTGTPPAVEVELNFDTDTLYIHNNEWIIFSYKTNGDKVNWARFIIDGLETSPNDEQHGGLELFYYFPGFEPGIHSLSFQVYTQSGTGSIADKVGAEGFLLQKDWVLIIVDDWEMGSAIVDTSFSEGFLNLNWEEYKGLNFEHYKLYKYTHTALPDQLVATITDQHVTTARDINYHGENSSYYVLTNDRFRKGYFDIEGPLPQISATNNTDGDIVLSWEIPPFWAALKGYRIMDDDISWTDQGFVPLIEINDPLTDSCIIPDPYFAHNYDIWFQLDPKGIAYLDNWIRPVQLATRTPDKVSYGFESPKSGGASTGIGNVVYFSNQNGLNFFNTQTLENIVKNPPSPLTRIHASSGNKYLIGFDSATRKLFLYDLEHPEKNKTLDFSESLNYISHIASVSDRGTGIIISDIKAILVDFISEKIITEKELPNDGLYRNFMSGDGNYFTLDTWGGYSWYTCENNVIEELTLIRANEEGTLFSDFLPGDATKVVTAAYDHVSVYDCKTQQLLKRWEFTPGLETTVYHVVKGSGQLFFSEGENLLLLNLTTGDRTLLGKSTNNNKWDLIYNNGQILWSEGKRLDVSDKI
ncbi:hypothetical protein SLH46_01595 [Draconibacterium sp. IB214405]|uniref:hypothetical protein n=1 Tax=Draconibacterium sp. IB214405 TaxID=3097352 RepID=UPI002A138BD3|nr:hypothetical protein [Draconibacterium sp. IB214405]MDX8337856.1 hypothetical protein [Draconibacterium sp. IB214405]